MSSSTALTTAHGTDEQKQSGDKRANEQAEATGGQMTAPERAVERLAVSQQAVGECVGAAVAKEECESDAW